MFKFEGAMLGYLYTVVSLMGMSINILCKLEGTMLGYLYTVTSLMGMSTPICLSLKVRC